MRKKYVVTVEGKFDKVNVDAKSFQKTLNSEFYIFDFIVKNYSEPVRCVNCRHYTKSIPDLVSYCHRIERYVPVELGGCLRGRKK